MNSYDVFIWVVKLGGFSAAAKKLHRSPSAISKQIGLLEQKLDVQLFDRTTRSLSVTEAGMIYFERCIDISQRINNAESELKELSGEPSGRINITWGNVISYTKVTDALTSFAKEYPGIKVNVKVADDIVNLIDENIDIAFRVTPLTDSSIIATQLFALEPVFCATPELIDKYGLPASLKEFVCMPLLLPNYINLSQRLRQFFPAIEGLKMEDHHEANDITVIYCLARKGMGAACLFRDVVEQDLAQGVLVDLYPNVKLPSLPVYLMYHRFNYTSKRITIFINFIKDYFRQ